MYGEAEVLPAARIPPEAWAQNEDYLFGIDLYHAGCFWEAHEVWEGIWRLEQPGSPEAHFYQGLIQLAAALLKARAGQWRGVRRLSEKSRAHLEQTAEAYASHMGLNLRGLLEAQAQCFGPIWRDEATAALGAPPRLHVAR